MKYSYMFNFNFTNVVDGYVQNDLYVQNDVYVQNDLYVQNYLYAQNAIEYPFIIILSLQGIRWNWDRRHAKTS